MSSNIKLDYNMAKNTLVCQHIKELNIWISHYNEVVIYRKQGKTRKN